MEAFGKWSRLAKTLYEEHRQLVDKSMVDTLLNCIKNAHNYRKVLNSGRAYYSFSNTFNAPFIQGRLLYKGAYYNRILHFPSKICYFEAFLANI